MAGVVQREALKIDAMMARPPYRRRNQELAGVQLAEGVSTQELAKCSSLEDY